MILQLRTPAKLNIGLWILGRRHDGYHELLSLFLPITLWDELRAEVAPELSVEYTPAHEFANDLVLQAARKLQQRLGIATGAKIWVRKQIPVGAGLGGGSSDAAACLLLLQRLWGRELPAQELAHCAAELGSDVPFFLHPTPAIVRGRGERLQPVQLRFPYPIVVLYPGFSISTAWAYAQLRQVPPPHRVAPPQEWEGVLAEIASAPEQLPRYFCNDFESVLLPHYPMLGELQRALYECGAAYAGLSGTGSALFAVFRSVEHAERALQLRERLPGAQAFLCHVLEGGS